MMRYFFHVLRWAKHYDLVGTELTNQHAVRLYMVGHALGLHDMMMRHDEPLQMGAVDEGGKIVATIDFSSEKPAARDAG